VTPSCNLQRGGILASTLRAVVILAVSVGAGLGYARYNNFLFFPDPVAEDAHKKWIEETRITLEDLLAFNDAGGTIIDARPRELYEEGHLDGPMVINIPANEVMDSYHDDRVMQYYGLELVIYCASTECEDAETLWHSLVGPFAFPPETIRVYHEGWRGIQEAGVPTATGPDLYAYPAEESYDPGADPYAEPDEFDAGESTPDESTGDESTGDESDGG